MMRARLLASLFALPLLALAAAAPDPGSDALSLAPVELASAAARLVAEPASPSSVGDALQPAPVPNVLTALPTVAADGGAALSPRLYHQHEQFGGDGFSAGSSVQSAQQRARPALGLGIAVPMN